MVYMKIETISYHVIVCEPKQIATLMLIFNYFHTHTHTQFQMIGNAFAFCNIYLKKKYLSQKTNCVYSAN